MRVTVLRSKRVKGKRISGNRWAKKISTGIRGSKQVKKRYTGK